MTFSIITPNYNGEAFLRQCIDSILEQVEEGIDLELIVIDGGSNDASVDIIKSYGDKITYFISEKDDGPADAINKGFQKATGDVVAWLNADDVYMPGTLKRVKAVFDANQSLAFCFGKCRIVNEKGDEIRKGITWFKELFFPISSRFVFQSINYISQPSMFFTRSAREGAGLLKTELTAAWDYEFILRLWHQGQSTVVKGAPLSCFCWHEGSISGQHFKLQFKEELDAARADAGGFSLQVFFHHFVRWGIVGAYTLMSKQRQRTN